MKIGISLKENSLDHIPNKTNYVENILTRISNLLKDNDQTVIGPKLKKIEEMEATLLKDELILHVFVKSHPTKVDCVFICAVVSPIIPETLTLPIALDKPEVSLSQKQPLKLLLKP